MRYIRFIDADNATRAALSTGAGRAYKLARDFDLIAAAKNSADTGRGLREELERVTTEESVDVDELSRDGRILVPIPVDGAARCLVTGTGLTHRRSAEIRDAMNVDDEDDSDSMKMYRMGERDGQPAPGQIGIQPEWFFKGLAQCRVPSGAPIRVPNYVLSAGEELELAGVYLILPDGTPLRLGYVLANDFSDHELEGKNYLYLAPSKLRPCAIGPELLIGDAPEDLTGRITIHRDGERIWDREVSTGDANMTHSIANLEHHHFKHTTLITPGDLHVHLFGCPVFSYGDGLKLADGDEIEMYAPEFGTPLRNEIVFEEGEERLIRVAAVSP